jgi:hypothetical protein
MDDLDRDLRTLDSIDAPDLWQDIARRSPRPPVRLPSPGRRTVIAVFSLGLSVIVLAWAAIVLTGSSPSDHLAAPGALSERTVTVLGVTVTVTSPSSWTLVDLWPLAHSIATWPDPVGSRIDLPSDIRDRGGLPILQVSNHDLGLTSSCTGTSPTGDEAVLYVAVNGGPWLVNPDGSPKWSHELTQGDGPCGEGMYAYREATSGYESRPYLVFAGFGPDASSSDRQIVLDAFSSLDFAPVELLPPAETTPGYVLDGLQLGENEYTVEARSASDGGVDIAFVNGRQPEVSSVRFPDVGRPGDPDLQFALSGLVTLTSPQSWPGLPPTNVALAVFGVVSARVATVEVRMPSAGTFEPSILPIPSSLGTSFSVFDIQVPPVTGGTVAALDADGNVIAEVPLGEAQSPAPSASPTLWPPTEAQTELRNALVAALTYYTDGATFVGFDPKTAGSIEPSLVFNASVSRPGEVSIREVTRSTILLTTTSSDGLAWCIADDQSAGKTTYAHADAQTIDECAGEVSAWG